MFENHYFLLGITECLEECLMVLAMLSITNQTKLKKFNETPTNVPVINLTEQDKEIIKAKYDLDIQLYENIKNYGGIFYNTSF